MKFKFTDASWIIDFKGVWLTLKVPESKKQEVQDFILDITNNKKAYLADIKPYRGKRSLDANGYMWKLLRSMAEKLNTTDKELYREMIRRVGQMVIVPIRDDAVDTYIRRWEANGEGWQVDMLGACRSVAGYSNLRCYYGSSVYNTKEMSILLDEIIAEAKGLGIDTITPKEKERLMSLMGVGHG